MIRTETVNLSVIKAVAYRRKLMKGGSGIVIVRENSTLPGIASVSQTSGEAIPAANNPKKLFPQEAFNEAIALTAGMPYKTRGSVSFSAGAVTEVPAPQEDEADEAIVSCADYLRIVDRYTDKNGRLSYDLLNKDMIKFAYSSSRVRRMIEEGAKQKEICSYAALTKFRSLSGNQKLTDAQVAKVVEFLDEASPKGVFREFNAEIRRILRSKKQ